MSCWLVSIFMKLKRKSKSTKEHIHLDVHLQNIEANTEAMLKNQRNQNNRFSLLNTKINSLKKLILTEMATNSERFDVLMGRLDTVTTDIAADYKQLLEAIQAGTAGQISDEQFAAHEANILQLEALGASVVNPVPPPVDPNA